jgi:hypothetical protein
MFNFGTNFEDKTLMDMFYQGTLSYKINCSKSHSSFFLKKKLHTTVIIINF